MTGPTTQVLSGTAYVRLSAPPGAFARGHATIRAAPGERASERLRISVWESEGGALLPAALRSPFNEAERAP